MILSSLNLPHLLDLYERCYGQGDHRYECFLRLNDDQLRYRFFENRVVFGTWDEQRLISSITLRRCKFPNLLISEGWLADPHCHLLRKKLDCYRESQQFVWSNGCQLIRVAKTRLIQKVWSINQQMDVGLHPYRVIETIPAGSLSRFRWINERYLWGRPADEEWIVQLAS